ncbi:Activating molecule in BECN1-regulated autophagy protein 1 [Larimichthys crocea]|uniref:Activating molecule in BECN1-regulated autophagy protein 1 n=1 Tax=Larimichthys crocea TaxID=215358 RepID=A0A6G0IXF7_LARCR|nr:Activating molecule in BECN1-regulated autophagy protein 1 [Larimichthys crocea]
MTSRQRNSVRILSSRERGSQTFGSQRLLQLLVEEKVRWMKWQSQKVELDSPRSTFLLAFSPTAAPHCHQQRTPLLGLEPARALAVVKTGSDTERVRWVRQNQNQHGLVRFDPLRSQSADGDRESINQQNEEDSEVPMDSVEIPHFRQRSFLPSQPVRRTPILHNFLHILRLALQALRRAASTTPSGRNSSLAANTSASDPPQPPPASTFSSARTEPRQPSERPSAFTSVYYSATSGIEPHSTSRPGPTGPVTCCMREGGVGPGMLPPRTSSSSISLLSVLRQQDSSSQSPVYTSASEGRGFPSRASWERRACRHEQWPSPFWDGAQQHGGPSRNVLQCNLSRYFMEFERCRTWSRL